MPVDEMVTFGHFFTLSLSVAPQIASNTQFLVMRNLF